MDQYGQTNDLQQAIDQVANKDNAEAAVGMPPMPPAEGGAEAPFSGDALPGVPVPEAPTEGAPAEVVPTAAPAEAPDAEAAAPAEAAPAAEAPVVDAPSAEAILSEAVPVDGDLAKVREGILRDLMPLMDKVNSTPEEKFDIYKDAMATLHDKSLISGAYKEATKFTDETKKADALIGLMQEIDKA